MSYTLNKSLNIKQYTVSFHLDRGQLSRQVIFITCTDFYISIIKI